MDLFPHNNNNNNNILRSLVLNNLNTMDIQ
jgi:hypothetical protein